MYPNCDFERTFLQKTKLLESSGGLSKRSSHRGLKFSSCYIAFPFVRLPQHFFIILFLFIQMQNSYLILDEYVSIKSVLSSRAGRSRSSVVFLVRTLDFGKNAGGRGGGVRGVTWDKLTPYNLTWQKVHTCVGRIKNWT